MFKLLLYLICIQKAFSLDEDWKQSFIGQIKLATIDSRPNVARIYVATSKNVVAALSLYSGDIIWRRVLEEGAQGVVIFFHSDDTGVVTLSKNRFVRVWSLSEGDLISEWSFPLNINKSRFIVENGNFYAIEPSPENELIIVHSYNLISGDVNDVAKKIPAKWLTHNSQCVTNQDYLACFYNNQDFKFLTPTKKDVHIRDGGFGGPVPYYPLIALSSSKGRPSFRYNNAVFTTNYGEQRSISISISQPCRSIHVEDAAANNEIFICVKSASKKSLDIEISNGSGDLVFKVNLQLENQIVSPRDAMDMLSCFCKSLSNYNCFCLVSTKDHTAIFVSTHGKVVWTRYGSLANITDTNIVKEEL